MIVGSDAMLASHGIAVPPETVESLRRRGATVVCVAADSRLIAAAGVNEVGDNGAAKQLANLRDALVLEGNSATLVDSWSHFAFRVGRDTRAALDGSKAQSDIVEQIDALRDAVSGVSLDEEAVNMIKFQRAYEANARFFSTIDQTLSILFSIVGR